MTSIDAGLAGRRLVLTGATGFVGAALVARILGHHPSAHLTVLARPKRSLNARDRIARVLHRLDLKPGADQLDVVEVDLADAAASDAVLRALGAADALIHSAAEVSFTAALDQIARDNIGGVAALSHAAKLSGSGAAMVHLSTAYVTTGQFGGHELRLAHDLDWRSELAASARRRGESDSDAVRRGRRRARAAGWVDAYPYSKALAERVLEQQWPGPLTILRPSIVESALRHPHPGWLEGFKTADPLLLAYGRGELTHFPGWRHDVLDVVPVDLVAAAALAAVALAGPTSSPRYLHLVSGSRNPLRLEDLEQQMRRFYSSYPLTADPLTPWLWRGARDAQLRAGLAVATAWGRRDESDLTRAVRHLLTLRTYTPYVQDTSTFKDGMTQHLIQRAALAAGHRDGFDVAEVDWDTYLHTHLTSLVRLTRARMVPLQRQVAPEVPGTGVDPNLQVEGQAQGQ